MIVIGFLVRHAIFFTNFLDFFNKHEQTSWFQTMEFIESIHAKLIRALEGGRHSWYSLWYCLLDIWLIFLFLLMIYMNLFYIHRWATLVSHKGVNARWLGMLFLPPNSKILWMCMLWWAISIFECCPWLPWHLFDYFWCNACWAIYYSN